MSTDTTVSPLRQRMIEDMAARKLGRHAQRSHIHSCSRFAAFLGRSPDRATADDVRRFHLHLIESGHRVSYRNIQRNPGACDQASLLAECRPFGACLGEWGSAAFKS